jgi:lysophospholipase L1-like esterase
MKTILCYGDSLTWGYDATGPGRHAYEDRWPSVLQAGLGSAVHVIAEGLNGRTTAFDDHLAGEDRNGASVLPTLLGTHSPVDLIVIMLGSNDMKPWIHGDPLAAQHGMRRLVRIVRGHAYPLAAPAPRILLVAPPVISETENAEFAQMFARGNEASAGLAPLYAALAEQEGCGFFDAGSVARPTPLDGVHLDAANTRAVGEALASIVRKQLGL